MGNARHLFWAGALVLFIVAPSSATHCKPVVQEFAFKPLKVPAATKTLLPRGSTLRFLVQLSSERSLMGYELGNSVSPEVVLTIVQAGKPIFRLTSADLDKRFSKDDRWFADARLMWVAHSCAIDSDLTYLLFQAGNAGGWALAINSSSGDRFSLHSLEMLEDGRVEFSRIEPQQVRTWTAAESCDGTSHASTKHYRVTTWQWSGDRFRQLQRVKTRHCFASFQDNAVRVADHAWPSGAR